MDPKSVTYPPGFILECLENRSSGHSLPPNRLHHKIRTISDHKESHFRVENFSGNYPTGSLISEILTQL